MAAESKLLQLDAAAELQIRVPRTVVSGSLSEIVDVLGDRFVLKPLGRGYFVASDGTPQCVFAQQVAADELCDVDFSAGPFLAQDYIEAECHLRIVTVGERVWSADLRAESLPTDWRADEAAHNSWHAGDHPEVEDLAVALAATLGVRFSSQDWIIEPGSKPVFLDLNPNGQWLFLPKPIADGVTHAIADLLIELTSE
jgi:glutathione synthase/RimK-type ligase-like ATP-grasp enzyme